MPECPCCGQLLPAGDLPRFRGRLRNRIIDIVAERPGIGMHELADRVYADDPLGGPLFATCVIRNTVHRMKAPLAVLGWKLSGRRFGWEGYRLERL